MGDAWFSLPIEPRGDAEGGAPVARGACEHERGTAAAGPGGESKAEKHWIPGEYAEDDGEEDGSPRSTARTTIEERV